MVSKKVLKKEFEKAFGYKGKDYFYSQGRVELLGNHLDHNGGKVLTSTISLGISAIASKTKHNYIRISNNIESTLTSEIIKQFSNVGGIDICIKSDLPIGCGLSSSACYSLLIAKIIAKYYGKKNKQQLIEIARNAESGAFGKTCGLLDQTAIVYGGVNIIDFKNTIPVVKKVKLPHKYKYIFIDTQTNHVGLEKEYNQIPKDMKAVAKWFNKERLIDIPKNEFVVNESKLKKVFTPLQINRCKHFYNELERVENYKVDFLSKVNASTKSSYDLLKNCYVESESEKYATQVRKLLKLGYVKIQGGGFGGILLVIKKEVK